MSLVSQGLVIHMLAFAWCGCTINTDFSGTQYTCPDGVSCPDGQTCVANICRSEPLLDAGLPDSGGGQPAIDCGEVDLLGYDFRSGMPWWAETNTDGSTVPMPNGVLRIETPAIAGNEFSFLDQFHTALKGQRFIAEVKSVIAAEPTIRFSEENTVKMSLEGTLLVGTIGYGEQTTTGSIPFNPSKHRFWSIVESDGTLSTQVSSDGLVWQDVHSRIVTIDKNYGHFSLLVRSLGTPGSVEFDNLMGGQKPQTTTCTLSARADLSDPSLGPNYFTVGNEGCATQTTNNRLVWTHSNEAGTMPYCTLEPIYLINLRGNTLGVENALFPTDRSGMFHAYQLVGEGGQAAFFVENGYLKADYCDPDCTFLAEQPLDPIAHRFWRFRGDGSLLWEVSPDGTNWTRLAIVEDHFNLGVVQAEYTWGASTPGSGTLEIANFGPMP